MHESFMKWERARTRAESRTTRLNNALSSSQDALEFWKDRVEDDNFDDLLVDAMRVRNGGQSSKAIARSRKMEKDSQQKQDVRGEEE